MYIFAGKYGTFDFRFFLEMIASCTTHLDLLKKKYETICYFNNNALKKCTNGKAFNIVTIAHFVYLPNLQF